MQNSTIKLSSILTNFQEKIDSIASDLEKKLESGEFNCVEQELKSLTDNLFNDLLESILVSALDNPSMEKKAKQMGKTLNLSVRKTEVSILLCTGKRIKIPSYYGSRKTKKKKRGPNGSGRHLLLDYWGFIGKASPHCYSLLSMLCVLCPSFEVAQEVLKHQGVKLDYKTIRRIVLKVGERCFAHRVGISLETGENLSGKRVIISTDGGRTRTRKVKKPCKTHQDSQTDLTTSSKRDGFETPWKEPKLLVIQVLDELGNLSKEDFPIYDSLIGNADDLFQLLEEYLLKLGISSVKQVLFIGDGAKWIWKRTQSLFERLGLDTDQYVEAIDYYHAAQHLHKIVKTLPQKNVPIAEQNTIYRELKNLL